MIDKQTLQKLLIYIFGIIVVYSVLRFAPGFKMDMNRSLTITLILFIVYGTLYVIYKKISHTVLSQNIVEESFSQCNTDCKVEGFDQPVIVTDQTVQRFQTPLVQEATPVVTTQTTQTIQPIPIVTTPLVAGSMTLGSPTVQTMPFTTTNNNKCRVVCDDAVVIQSPTAVTNTVNTFMPNADQIGYTPSYYTDGMFYDRNPYVASTYTTKQNQIEALRDVQIVQSTDAALEHRARSMDGYDSAYQIPGSKSEYLRQHKTVGTYLDNPADDLQYTNYNHLPLAAGYKSHPDDYGFSYLPPEKWYPQGVFPPICVTTHRAPILASLANGTPTDLKEFNVSRRFTQPDMIDTVYITEKLNLGK
jgi:disulfide bond formation protein DsbB